MSAHLIKAMMLRTVEARAVCQWVCREKSELINEMNKDIKDGQERKVRELLVLMGGGGGGGGVTHLLRPLHCPDEYRIMVTVMTYTE